VPGKFLGVDVAAFEYRVTKYDPANRDPDGRYLADDWTDVTDVGHVFAGNTLTREDYLRVETAYVQAARRFMEEAGVGSLAINDLEVHTASLGADLRVREGALVEGEALERVCRLALRSEIWCRLEAPGAFIHFGWDYYMYLGVPRRCPRAEGRAGDDGLFVEPFASPYFRAG